jgi:hypothetical protein
MVLLVVMLRAERTCCLQLLAVLSSCSVYYSDLGIS